jgi:hypothetical protein
MSLEEIIAATLASGLLVSRSIFPRRVDPTGASHGSLKPKMDSQRAGLRNPFENQRS